MSNPSKSEAIRRILEAVPEIRPAHAQAILAKEGIDITPDLFRVVKMNFLRDRREQDEAERRYKEYWSPEAIRHRDEAAAREAEARLRVEAKRGQPGRFVSEGLDLDDDLPPPMVLSASADAGPTLTPRPAQPPEVNRRLTAQQKRDLLAKVQRSFSPAEWAKIVADHEDDERIAEDLAQECFYGASTEEAISRIVEGLRRKIRPAWVGDEELEGDAGDDLDEVT